jgi:hypothetical protein
MAIFRIFAYVIALHVLLAYALVAYAIYAHVWQTWSGDDPRMIIPGMAFISLIAGTALAALTWIFRRRLSSIEAGTLGLVAAAGLLLLPVVFGSALVFKW